MKLITIFLLSVSLISNCFGQLKNPIKYIEYEAVIKEINASKSDLREKWDYEAILLLDRTYINKIKQFQPDLVEDFKKIFSVPIPDAYRERIPIKIKSLKDCINNAELLNNIYSKTNLFSESNFNNLLSPIYIKDNRIAVYDIYNGHYERHRMTLSKDTIIIELISTIIE